MLRGAAGVALLIAACAHPIALAQPTSAPAPRARWRLVYRAGTPGCPPQRELERQVSGRVGWQPFHRDGQAVIEVAVAAASPGLRASIVHMEHVDGAVLGERTVSTSSGNCEELVSVVGVAVCIVVDPLGGGSSRSPVPRQRWPAPGPGGGAAAAAARSSEVPRSGGLSVSDGALGQVASATVPSGASPRASQRWRSSVFGLLGGGLGGAPVPTVAGAMGLGVARGRARGSLEGTWERAGGLDVSGGGELTAARRFGALSVGWQVGHWRLGPLLQAGVRTAATRGLATTRTDHELYLAAGARVGVVLPAAGRLRSLLSVDLLAPLTRTTYRVDGVPVWTTPALAGGLALGVEWGS